MCHSIDSRRLVLRTLGIAVLEALLAGDRASAGGALACLIPAEVPLDQMPLAMRLAQLRREPTHEPWLLRALIHRDSGTMIGHIGFHTPPRPEYLAAIAADGVEFGYSVHQPFRRQGYATEAAVALMHWAYTQHDQRSFVLSISPENIPSTNMAGALGFVPCGSHIDEEDGLEIEYLRCLADWPAEWTIRFGNRGREQDPITENQAQSIDKHIIIC